VAELEHLAHLVVVEGPAAERGFGHRRSVGTATAEAPDAEDICVAVYTDGQLYNGCPAAEVTSFGAKKDSIEVPARRGQVAGRGVLLDVARHRGLDQLAPNTVITPEELDQVAEAERVAVLPGDIVVVRTGWWREFLAKGDGDAWAGGSPGLSWRCAEWLHARSAAAVASDNIAVECMPPELGIVLLFHILAIRDMGMMLGEIWNLEELSADCASDGVYEFLLVAPALPFTGAVGSPLNPVAIK
jgi:kynurenine formamidase